MKTAPDVHVAVFTKPLVPGEVKTRLIPSVGAHGAVEIQRAMLWNTLTVARQAAGRRVSLWVAGEPELATLQEFHDAFALTVRAQQGHGLGVRMRSALTALLSEHSRVLLVGSDCPVLTADDVRGAATTLNDPDIDAGFIPAEDGGYVLVGLAPHPARQQAALDAVFGGIPWSTDQVMARTRTQLTEAGLCWAEQPTLWDLDRPEDVRRAQALGVINCPGQPGASQL